MYKDICYYGNNKDVYYYDGNPVLIGRRKEANRPSDNDIPKSYAGFTYQNGSSMEKLKSKFIFFSKVGCKLLEIKKIIINDPATIIFWADGSKTVVKTCDDDIFNAEKGLCLALFKRLIFALGINKNYYKLLKQMTNDDFSEVKSIIKKVYFNGDLSVMIFTDGSKTFCKRSENDEYDSEMAVMILILKRYLGNSFMKKIFKANLIQMTSTPCLIHRIVRFFKDTNSKLSDH